MSEEDEKKAKALVEEDLRKYYTGLNGLKFTELTIQVWNPYLVCQG